MGESDDDASLRAWLRQWGECVATAEFDEAATLFDPSVVGFGTRAEVAVGLEQLMAEQWRLVWPAISGFAFDVDGAHLLIAGDRKHAAIATTWTSTGRRADGTTGLRPGRATIVVRRDDEASPWRGIHTHFSLAPDAPGPLRRPSARR